MKRLLSYHPQFAPAPVEAGSSNPDRPGWTDCASLESVPSASDKGASDVPAITSIDVKGAYVLSSGGENSQASAMAFKSEQLAPAFVKMLLRRCLMSQSYVLWTMPPWTIYDDP